MGFFKSIGKKLKRVISLKNLTRVATGQFGAVGKSVLRVVTTDNLGKDPVTGRSIIVPAGTKLSDITPSAPAPAPAPVQMPKMVENTLDAYGAKFANNVTSELGKTEAVKDATSFLTKVGVQAFWENNKKWIYWIIGFFVALILFFVGKWAFFSGKSRKGGRR